MKYFLILGIALTCQSCKTLSDKSWNQRVAEADQQRIDRYEEVTEADPNFYITYEHLSLLWKQGKPIYESSRRFRQHNSKPLRQYNGRHRHFKGNRRTH